MQVSQDSAEKAFGWDHLKNDIFISQNYEKNHWLCKCSVHKEALNRN